MKKYIPYLLYFISILYLESLFKILSVKQIDILNSISLLLFIVYITILMTTINRLSKEKTNKLIFIITLFALGTYFSAQLCIKDMFGSYFTFNVLGASSQVVEYQKEILDLLYNNIIGIILLYVPFAFSIIFQKKYTINQMIPTDDRTLKQIVRENKIKNNIVKNKSKQLYTSSILIILSLGLYNVSLLVGKNKNLSSYNLIYKVNENNIAVQKIGVINAFIVDVSKIILDFKEEFNLSPNIFDENKPSQSEKIYEYNIEDIDFLSINETKDLEDLSYYFSVDTPTYKNEYTSMFKDKNLIFIMAETFNMIAVDKKRTPTLYKLVNEGFNFTNFYSPTIYSTIGGEFQLLTGLYPATDFLSIFKSGKNTFTYGLANVFKDNSYDTFAYHNNTYTFQSRDKYLASLGFTNFKACKNGLELLMDCEWLASDVSLIETTFDEYISSEKFMTFYATVSGHGDYFKGHTYGDKYIDLVEGNYSTGIKYYLAAQIELDKALELLISKLEKENILEDTVIVLAGDHHPYYLSIDEINEASSYTKDSVVEIDHSNLIIYNSQMTPTQIGKVGSQIDIIPTVYNLFGITYDSRLFAGKDILSTTPGLAIFGDRSWTSDYGTYFSSTDKFILKENQIISDTYVDNMNELVASRINLSNQILKTNYYKYID